ncbi:hypothetical protein PoB_002716900 [Plakobranchus ocellatus]|uniref:Uncharacterized protein n=1 Tax=Plakobranchus ocellatus TaxID=259542 RepID=A0AAV3ZZA1_9GAST|nr:hypothetical protein PoB_002716900 [Plakobranchus ocellatus]
MQMLPVAQHHFLSHQYVQHINEIGASPPRHCNLCPALDWVCNRGESCQLMGSKVGLWTTTGLACGSTGSNVLTIHHRQGLMFADIGNFGIG